MGTTDFGSQKATWDFKSAGKSELFNVVNYKLLEKGVYEGGTLTYNDATHIDIAPILVYITDSTTGVGVRIETTATVTLEVSSGSPYIVARYAWNNTENNYMDLLAVNFGSILTDDIIIGRCTYPTGSLSATFDYKRKTAPSKIETISSHLEFKVIPTEPYSDVVYVNAGTFTNGEKTITFAGGNSPIFSGVNPNTITDSRIDLLYIDDSGVLQIEEGVDQVTPLTPVYDNRFIVAEVYLDNTNTYIDGNDITEIKNDVALNDEGIKALDDRLNPIGTIKMFDAENAGGTSGGTSGAWVDNVSLPGWYACISTNSIYGCPNLVDTFVMGKVVAGSGASGGSNTLLDHTHSVSTQNIDHTHNTILGSHRHSYPIPLVEDNGGSVGAGSGGSRTTATVSNYTDLGTKTSGEMSANATHTHTVGSGNIPTLTDSRPAFYSVIYIRKCL